jgi:hypothetical protein
VINWNAEGVVQVITDITRIADIMSKEITGTDNVPPPPLSQIVKAAKSVYEEICIPLHDAVSAGRGSMATFPPNTSFDINKKILHDSPLPEGMCRCGLCKTVLPVKDWTAHVEDHRGKGEIPVD